MPSTTFVWRDGATETPCVWRFGRLRRRVVGLNCWRPVKREGTPARREPPDWQVRQYWAPLLSGRPWWRATDPAAFMKNRRCFGCGGEFPYLHRGHIVHRAWQGGTDHPANLHMLCRMCHEGTEGTFGVAYWRWFSKITLTDAVIRGASMRAYRSPDPLVWGKELTLQELTYLSLQYCAGVRGPMPSEQVRAEINAVPAGELFQVYKQAIYQAVRQ